MRSIANSTVNGQKNTPRETQRGAASLTKKHNPTKREEYALILITEMIPWETSRVYLFHLPDSPAHSPSPCVPPFQQVAALWTPFI